MLSSRFPYPCNHGDQLIVFNRLRVLSKCHEITLLTFYSGSRELAGYDKIIPYCKAIYPIHLPKWRSTVNVLWGLFFSDLPLQVCYYNSILFQKQLNELVKREDFDIIHAYLLRTANHVINIEKPKILELIDSYQLNIRTRLRTEKSILYFLLRKELSRVSKYENKIHGNFNYLTLVSQKDALEVRGNNVKIVPLGIDFSRFFPNLESRHHDQLSIVFTGNMSYAPNISATLWFAENCLPLIQKEIPDVIFTIAGIKPSKEIRLLGERRGISVLGFVDSIATVLRQSHVAVAPMQSGSGLQIKILEAMACQIPVVSTSIGVNALPSVENNRHILVADDSKDFSLAVVSLLLDKEKALNIAKNGFLFAHENYTWESSCKKINDLYQATISEGQNSIDSV